MYDDGEEVLLPDGSHGDTFEREPYVVSFFSANTGRSYTVLCFVGDYVQMLSGNKVR